MDNKSEQRYAEKLLEQHRPYAENWKYNVQVINPIQNAIIDATNTRDALVKIKDVWLTGWLLDEIKFFNSVIQILNSKL